MRLVDSKYRLDVRSTAEMTVDQLSLLRIPLESSKTILEYEAEHRPRRGGIRFGFVPLLMLYLLMECRKTTYKGVLRNLSDHDCACLGLPAGRDGRFLRPSVGTLNTFVNKRLAEIADGLIWEVARAVMEAAPKGAAVVVTLDSTPLPASCWNKDADYSPHYEIRMDKAHIIMLNGHPLFMFHSNGNAGDNPFAAPLIELFRGVDDGGRRYRVYGDGQYDSFETYAHVYVTMGSLMTCNVRENAVLSGVDEGKVREEYCGLWRAEGYDPHRKGDVDFMLRFLYDNGKAETVGKYLRDRCLEAEGQNRPRHVCETVHRAMKRWVDFDILRIRKATKEVRVKCRFLCVQLLSTLFREYDPGT